MTDNHNLKADLDEADRRAGAAERALTKYRADEATCNRWLSDAKRAEGYGDNVPFDDVWNNLCAERDRLRLALLADPVRADTERLDWLDRINTKTNDRNRTKYGWKFDINHNRAALTDSNVPALTVRAAIDAAIHKR